MAQVVSDQHYVIENSNSLTRPDLKTFLKPDTNEGLNDVNQYNELKRYNQLHIPNVSGPLDYSVSFCDVAVNTPMPITTKKRTDLRILDPLSGFVSASGEVTINSGKYNIASFGKSRIEPQTSIPQVINSIRPQVEAIDEIRRVEEGETEPDLKWNSQKVIDTVLKSRLGGWTSEYDRRAESSKPSKSPFKLREIFPNIKLSYTSEEERDKLAKNYFYSTSTQEAYSQVNWDSKIPRKLHAPVATFEKHADPLKKTDQLYQRPQIWQTIAGTTWDRAQERYTQFTREPVAFMAPTKRGNHLPGYSGHIGGKNLESMDDVIEKFEPFTVLRTTQPKLPEPNYKQNIPGYTGHSHHFKTTSVSHYDQQGRPYTTTAAFHREMPMINQNHPDIPSLSGDFARIQTKVPPQNPYDNVKRNVDPGINHSIDHVKHPTVTPKKPTMKIT